jgi:hypothetical protein
MSRRLLAATLIASSAFGLASVSGCKCTRSPDPGAATGSASAARPEHWVSTQSHDLFIVEDKRDIDLTADQAEALFLDHFPKLRSDWRSHVRGPIEPRPGARPRPDAGEPLLVPRQSAPVAIVTGYSDRMVVVKVLEPLGRMRGYRVHACHASLRIPRQARLDELLGLEQLANTFGREVRGIRQGSTPEQVRAALGEPTRKHQTKLPGYFRWYYAGDKLQVVFSDGVVLQLGDAQ